MGDLSEEHLIEPEDRAQDQARDGTHQVDLSNQLTYFKPFPSQKEREVPSNSSLMQDAQSVLHKRYIPCIEP